MKEKFIGNEDKACGNPCRICPHLRILHGIEILKYNEKICAINREKMQTCRNDSGMLFTFIFVLAFAGLAFAAPNIIIRNFETNSSEIHPGDTVNVRMFIENTGDTSAKQVSATPKLSGPFSLIGTTPMGIGDINNGAYAVKTITLKISDDASEGISSLDLVFSFKDISSNPYQTTQTINLQITGKEGMDVSLSSCNPSKPKPEDIVSCTFAIQNTGTKKLESVNALLTGNGILPINGKTLVNVIEGKTSASASFSFQVKDSAEETENVTVSLSYGNKTVDFPFQLAIDKKKENIVLDIVSSDPKDVYYDEDAKFAAVLYNNEDNELKNVYVEFFSDDFSINWADRKVFLGNVLGNMMSPFTMLMKMEKQKTIGTLKAIIYYELYGKNKTREVDFAIPVKENPKFEMDLKNQGRLEQDYESVKIVATVKNNGNGISKKTKVVLSPEFPFTTAASLLYIGDLAPDNQTDVEFYVDVSKDAKPGTFGLSAFIEYENGDGDVKRESLDVPLRISDRSPRPIDFWWLAIVALVVLVRMGRKGGKK